MRRRALGTPQVEVLDRAWIRQRRLTLGMEQDQLAELMALTTGESIRRLERESNQAQLTLAQVSLLADALGASVGEMLTADERSDSGQPMMSRPSAPSWPRRRPRCRSTSWPPRSTGLSQRWTVSPTSCGAAVSVCNGSLTSTCRWPLLPIPVRSINVSESMVRVRGLNIDEAAELEALLKGDKRARRHGLQVYMPRLEGAGLVRVVPSLEMKHARHNLELTDTARFNLCLDEAAG